MCQLHYYTFILHTSYFYDIPFYEININSHTKNINEVILLPGKLYKTQTGIMSRGVRCFTRSNHTKSCRLPVPRFQKLELQETHTFHKKLLKNSTAPIIIIGDLIATGLRRHRQIWKNYFKDVLNLGICGDRIDNVLRSEWNISLQRTKFFVVIHCGNNNVDQSQPEDIAVGVLKVAETFMKNHPKITTIITGILPRDKTYSFRRAKIDETNNILKAKCKNHPQTYFMDQDDDWVKSDFR